jgi:glutaminase
MNCSILVNVESLARFGAMLSNNGVNPSTGERLLKAETVQSVVTVMTTCGMYNGAGKFTKDLGIPSKSGVAGGLLSVVPGIGAIATWSPKLNDEGNTVKGIGMVQKLGHIYCNFNLFHRAHNKKDVLTRPFQTIIKTVIAACECASNGNMEGLSRLEILGVDLNQGDYDKRTPLHLAVSSGHFDIIQFLIKKKVNVNPVDRWQATPLDDAKTDEIINFLTMYGAVKGGHSLDY